MTKLHDDDDTDVPAATRPRPRRLLIVGGGPIGLEMAVAAVQQSSSSEKLQQWEVTLVERCDRLCANVVSWQHVRLFSSWTLNVSHPGRKALASIGLDTNLPTISGSSSVHDSDPDNNYWTGKEYLERYLYPLGQYLTNSGRCTILLNTEVVSIGKDSSQLFKGDMDHNRRTETSFRTLVQVGKEEQILISDAVVDASGSYGNGNWLGLGGLPALGERRLSTTTNHNNNNIIVRTIPDVANDMDRYLNKTTAVFGSGFSAITTIHKLQELAATSSSSIVTVHWCTRRGNNNNNKEGTPLYETIDNDPLPQRQTLSNLANTLAVAANTSNVNSNNNTKKSNNSNNHTITNPMTANSNNFRLVYHPHVQLESIITKSSQNPTHNANDGNDSASSKNTTVDLVLRDVIQDLNSRSEATTDDGVEVGGHDVQPPPETILLHNIDTVIANVGYRPDTSIYQELQVHQCYATEGPMKLAAALLSSSGANSVDCLAQVVPGKETLRTSEPSFFIIGMKSYGRSSKFLLSVGHQQVQHVMELLNE